MPEAPAPAGVPVGALKLRPAFLASRDTRGRFALSW
jgi:hypothetical protein